MSRKDSQKTADDSPDEALFREAMRGVRTRLPSDRMAPDTPPPDPRPRAFEADEAEALRESMERDIDDVLIAAGDILDYRGSGLHESAWRRLRRGGYRIGDELDLHGLNSREAHEAVRGFLARCMERDIRCVRIIHGKGLRSGDAGPVLKRELDAWLRRRKDVLAFHSARHEDGGAGAVYVLLRRRQLTASN